MPIEPSEFRRIMGHWVSGVAVIGTRLADGTPRGLTASAVSSLSLHPPLLLVCIAKSAETHDCIREAGIFAVNVLAADQEPLARRFAGARDRERRFEDVGYATETTGAPILSGVLAWADCELRAVHDGGDHSIFVGEVVGAGARETAPLVAYRGAFQLT